MEKDPPERLEPFQLQERDIFTFAIPEYLYKRYLRSCRRVGKTFRDPAKNCPYWDDDLVSRLVWDIVYVVIKRTDKPGDSETFPTARLECLPLIEGLPPPDLTQRLEITVYDLHYFGAPPRPDGDEVRVRVLRRAKKLLVLCE